MQAQADITEVIMIAAVLGAVRSSFPKLDALGVEKKKEEKSDRSVFMIHS